MWSPVESSGVQPITLNWLWTLTRVDYIKVIQNIVFTRVDYVKSPPKNKPRASPNPPKSRPEGSKIEPGGLRGNIFGRLRSKIYSYPSSKSVQGAKIAQKTPKIAIWGPVEAQPVPTWPQLGGPNPPKWSQKHTKIDAGERSKTTSRKNIIFPQNYATSGITLHWFWTLTRVDYSENLSFS